MKAKTTLNHDTEKTIKSLIITLGLMIMVLASASFFIANGGSQKGYTLQQMKIQNEDLKDTNEELHVEIVNTTSSTDLEETAKGQGKTEIEGETFITPEDNLVQ